MQLLLYSHYYNKYAFITKDSITVKTNIFSWFLLQKKTLYYEILTYDCDIKYTRGRPSGSVCEEVCHFSHSNGERVAWVMWLGRVDSVGVIHRWFCPGHVGVERGYWRVDGYIWWAARHLGAAVGCKVRSQKWETLTTDVWSTLHGFLINWSQSEDGVTLVTEILVTYIQLAYPCSSVKTNHHKWSNQCTLVLRNNIICITWDQL